MPKYFTAFTILLLILMVMTRAQTLKKRDIDTVQFGKTDRKDYIIPPFAIKDLRKNRGPRRINLDRELNS